MSARRLLVTGAGGFVGRHIVSAAAKAGYEVHATGRRLPSHPLDGVTWHALDLLADDRSTALIRDICPTHLCHAAWETTHGSYWTSIDNALWVGVTARLAHAFADAGGQRFVLVGSCAEYEWSSGVMSEEASPVRPHTFYGACKLAAHDMVQAMAQVTPFTAATGRIFFAYGPHENENRFVPYICRRLARDESAELSSGVQIRDFLHVDDVARAFLALLASDEGGAFNIGIGAPTRLADIAETIGAVSGRADLLHFGAKADRADDIGFLVPSIERLRALGWSPRLSLEEGLRQTYAWWKDR